MIEEAAEDRQSLIDAKAKTNAEIASGIRPPAYGMLCETLAEQSEALLVARRGAFGWRLHYGFSFALRV